MCILNELLDLKGKEVMVFDIDDKIDELYERYFEPVEFNEKSRVYRYRDYFIKVKYLFEKKKSISMLDTVKITEIEAIN